MYVSHVLHVVTQNIGCMCVPVYACTHISIFVYMCVSYVTTCMCKCVYICAYVSLCLHMYVCVCLCVHVLLFPTPVP